MSGFQGAEAEAASLVDVPVLSAAGGATVVLWAVEPEVAGPPEVCGHCHNHRVPRLDLVARMEGGTLGRHMGPGEGPCGLGLVEIHWGSLDWDVVKVD